MVSSVADWGMPKKLTIMDDDGFEIATIESVQPYCLGAKQEHKDKAKRAAANANLIALAPEMYEILNGLLKWQAYMGGWEAPIWGRAKNIVGRIKG